MSNELSRPAKLMFWVIGVLNELFKLDVLEAIPFDISPKGIALFDQLDVDTDITDQEVHAVMATLLQMHDCPMDDLDTLVMTIIAYRDDRELLIDEIVKYQAEIDAGDDDYAD